MNIQILVSTFLILLILLQQLVRPVQATDCFTSQRMPRVVQVEVSSSAVAANEGVAIAVSFPLYSLFVGGSITQTDWLRGLSGWAHVGRLNFQTNIWTWQKQFAEQTDQTLLAVTALAIDPSDTKVACYGSSFASSPSNIGYIFVIDAVTGTLASGLTKMNHAEPLLLKSSALFLNSEGRALMAFSKTDDSPAIATLQQHQIVSYDSIANQITYSRIRGFSAGGTVASFADDSSTGDIYAGGSIKLASENWNLAIYKLDSAFQAGTTDQTPWIKLTHTGDASCDGHTNQQQAPYISHLGYELSSATGEYQLFGLTQAHNWDKMEAMREANVFRAKLQAQGLLQVAAGDFKIVKLEIGHANSLFLGMRPQMEYNAGQFFIHCIYGNVNDSLNYMKVSPDSLVTVVTVRFREGADGKYLATEAVWAGTRQATLQGVTYFESYWVGTITNNHKYKSVLTDSDLDLKANSYFIASLIEDSTTNCVVSNTDGQNVNTSANCNDLAESQTNAFWQTDIVRTTFDQSKFLTVHDLDLTFLQAQQHCNNGQGFALSDLGEGNSLDNKCFNNMQGASGSIDFNPPNYFNMQEPVCTNNIPWYYTVETDKPRPNELQIWIEQPSTLRWGTTPGFSGTPTPATYIVTVTAFIPTDGALMHSIKVFDYQLTIDCCGAPTIITPPAYSSSVYNYIIGDTSLDIILLSDSFQGDNPCCQIAPQTPSITWISNLPEIPPAGLFDGLVGVVTTRVAWTDVQADSPVGLFQVTYEPEPQACVLDSLSTNYVVQITNDCVTNAIITIDATNEILMPIPTITATYIIKSPATSLLIEWNDAGQHIIPSLTFCGPISQELVDATVNSVGLPLDPSIMSFTADPISEKGSLTISTDDLNFAGIYTLKIKAYFTNFGDPSGFPSVNFFERDFQVEIVDPCPNATLQIDSTNTVFTAIPDATESYLVGAVAQVVFWDENDVLKSIAPSEDPCGALKFELWQIDSTTGSEIALDPDLFTTDATSTQLSIETGDFGKVGEYTIRLKVFYEAYTSVLDTKDFKVEIVNACLAAPIQIPDSPLESQIYYIGTNSSLFDIQLIAQQTSGIQFNHPEPNCPALQFTAQLFYFTEEGQETQGPIDVSESVASNFAVSFSSVDGTFIVNTSDASLQGFHKLRVTAYLSDYPVSSKTDEVVVPLEFKWCQVDLANWFIEDVKVPPEDELMQPFNEPVFTYTDNDICGYFWSNFEIISVLDAKTSTKFNSYADYLYLDSTNRTLAFENNKQDQQELVLEVTLKAQLSDQISQVYTSFTVIFESVIVSDINRINTAPLLRKAVPKDIYLMQYNQEDQIIELGEYYDPEDDHVECTFQCLSCNKKTANNIVFLQKDLSKSIIVKKGTIEGIYRIKLILKDDFEKDPKSTEYKINIRIEGVKEDEIPPVPVPEPPNPPDDKPIDVPIDLNQGEKPTLTLKELSFVGELTVTFSQKMKVVEDLSLIDTDALEFELIPDESNSFEDKADLAFTWTVIQFSERFMKIQIEWAKSYQISVGVARDILKVTVKDNEHFFSAQSQQKLEVGEIQQIRAPQQMPNDEFTQSYTSTADAAQSVTNVVLVGNFFINLLLSGAMTFLWGMLNCMQIVSHFDLVNITMPSNANHLFKILVAISTFNILPTEAVIDEIEGWLGIVNDNFQLTQSFIDFQFDSSGPIRNLQIMFLAMVLLAAFPILLLVIRIVFFWSTKVQNCIRKVNSVFFFNLYLRFGLEAYLELSLSSILRFHNFTFGSSSEYFHSIFASVLFMAVLSYLLFSVFFLQWRYKSLDTVASKKRFGALYLGLKTRERTALLSPFIFMLRRLLYAGILVSWSERSYFQIQTIIFKCSIVMIFTGYMRPYQTRDENYLELINDTFIILCSYFLIIFSALVADAETRYISGWPLVGLIGILVGLNLTVIIVKGLTLAIHKCRLRLLRRHKNFIIMQARQELKLQHKEISMTRNQKNIEEKYSCQEGFQEKENQNLQGQTLLALSHGNSLQVQDQKQVKKESQINLSKLKRGTNLKDNGFQPESIPSEQEVISNYKQQPQNQGIVSKQKQSRNQNIAKRTELESISAFSAGVLMSPGRSKVVPQHTNDYDADDDYYTNNCNSDRGLLGLPAVSPAYLMRSTCKQEIFYGEDIFKEGTKLSIKKDRESLQTQQRQRVKNVASQTDQRARQAAQFLMKSQAKN